MVACVEHLAVEEHLVHSSVEMTLLLHLAEILPETYRGIGGRQSSACDGRVQRTTADRAKRRHGTAHKR